MPPRHGKSELSSHYFPAWFLSRFRDRSVMLASYSGDYATEWGRKVRQTLEQHPELRVRLNPDSKAAGRWNTAEGGGMYAAGVEGGQTGRGAAVLVIDDPIKNLAEAYSPTVREAIWNWFQGSAYTRLDPNASIVIPMTRWHEDDLAGRLLREAANGGEQWTEIRFPAIAEGDDVLGRVAGDALWPWRYNAEQLAKIEKAVGPLVWAALYQQRPLPAGTKMFPASAFRVYPFAPALSWFDRTLVSVDAAFKDKATSSYVVIQLWGLKGARALLLDQVREQMDFTRTCAEMLGLQRRHRLGADVDWYVEAKANGPAIISALSTRIPRIWGVEVRGSKVARAAAVQPFVAAGNVWLPNPDHAPWVRAFLLELSTFPAGATDDQVDAMSQALEQAWLRGAVIAGEIEMDLAALLMSNRWHA